ncbi:MAG: hypothetical protein IJP44_14620 [Bacteroidales bacterium]|nr:hypothetical protein [Bacteroidales bacterium]
MEIPEYIEGIPTQKAKSKERTSLIRDYYAKLWKKLQKARHNNSVFNKYLGVDVFVVEKESDKKTIFAASKNWQSTYAVKHLEEVITHATKIGDGPVYDKPKGNTQKANGYKNIVVLHYAFSNDDIPYLNFFAKLTVGIKADNKHVQYCRNKVEFVQ